MLKKSAQWRLTVSSETDKRVRRVLEALGRRGDLSQFVEEAVKARLVELSADKEPRRPSVDEVEPPAESSK